MSESKLFDFFFRFALKNRKKNVNFNNTVVILPNAIFITFIEFVTSRLFYVDNLLLSEMFKSLQQKQ